MCGTIRGQLNKKHKKTLILHGYGNTHTYTQLSNMKPNRIKKNYINQIESREMIFLRTIAEYKTKDKIK